MKKGLLLLAISVTLTIMITGSAMARGEGKEEMDKGLYLKECGFMFGWTDGSLQEEEDNYQTIPLFLRFGFDLTPFVERIDYPNLLELEVEPFLSLVLSPETNVEGGANLLLKYASPLGPRFLRYVEIGSGMLYTTQHLREQSIQFNLLFQAGCGLQYFIRENISLNVGYRFRHFSNANIKMPNAGIDTHSALIGFSFFY